MLHDKEHKFVMFRGLPEYDSGSWIYGWPVYSKATDKYYITTKEGQSTSVREHTIGRLRLHDKYDEHVYDNDVVVVERTCIEKTDAFHTRMCSFMQRNSIQKIHIHIYDGDYGNLAYTIYFVRHNNNLLTEGDVYLDSSPEQTKIPYKQEHTNVRFIKRLVSKNVLQRVGDIFTEDIITDIPEE